MRISHAQAQALAAFVARIRDDWDHPGIVAAITKAAPLGTPTDIGTALCRLAANTDLRTPAILADPGPHWSNTTVATRTPPVMCPEHSDEKAGACGKCIRLAVDPERARELARLAKASIPNRQVTHRHPAPTPDTERIDTIRQQIDEGAA